MYLNPSAYLTVDEKAKIISMYKTGNYNFTQLAKLVDRNYTTISKFLRSEGFKSKPLSEIKRKYPIKEDFFDNIDTQEKAYFLGMLYADGYNNEKWGRIVLSLKESDMDLVIKLKNLIQPSNPLSYVDLSYMMKNRSMKCENHYRLVLCSRKISQRLASIGCIQGKSLVLEFPTDIPDELIKHFIRGFFDGDGCLYTKNKCYKVVFISSINFCHSLQNLFKEKLGIKSRINKPSPSVLFRLLSIEGRVQIKTLLDWMYLDSTIELKRKYEKYLDAFKS